MIVEPDDPLVRELYKLVGPMPNVIPPYRIGLQHHAFPMGMLEAALVYYITKS
jgi:hypothetical protein